MFRYPLKTKYKYLKKIILFKKKFTSWTKRCNLFFTNEISFKNEIFISFLREISFVK
jgi:hypothetical protein